MAQQELRLTAGEKTRAAGLVARMAKRGTAGEDVYLGDLTRRLDRITNGAAERNAREQEAMQRQLHTARKAVAVAKTTLRTADRAERPAAKTVLKRAEGALRRTEQAARRIGL